jgi:hypothetical protein
MRWHSHKITSQHAHKPPEKGKVGMVLHCEVNQRHIRRSLSLCAYGLVSSLSRAMR